MGSPDAAAWVSAGAAIGQALLSVGTIVAATWIATRQERVAARIRESDRKEAKEDALVAARDHAIELAHGLIAWDTSLDIWRAAIDEGNGRFRWGNVSRLAEDPNGLNIPEPVLRLAGQYRVLGPATEAVQNAVVARDDLKLARPRAVQLWKQKELHGEGGVSDDDIVPIFDAIERYCKSVKEAREAVVRLRDRRI